MMVLLLDDQSIEGYGHTVTAELAMPTDDLSGQGSSSMNAEKGFKPQRLRVKLNIQFTAAQWLKKLRILAQAIDTKTGKRRVYNIVNDTADAMGVRQVRFSEKFTTQELDTVQAWQVTFVLLEIQSTPEKIEAKTLTKPVTNDSKTPVNDAPAVAESAQAEQPESIGWFEQSILAPLDNYLADETDETDEIQS